MEDRKKMYGSLSTCTFASESTVVSALAFRLYVSAFHALPLRMKKIVERSASQSSSAVRSRRIMIKIARAEDKHGLFGAPPTPTHRKGHVAEEPRVPREPRRTCVPLRGHRSQRPGPPPRVHRALRARFRCFWRLRTHSKCQRQFPDAF